LFLITRTRNKNWFLCRAYGGSFKKEKEEEKEEVSKKEERKRLQFFLTAAFNSDTL
jgi:hypothetical protein